MLCLTILAVVNDLSMYGLIRNISQCRISHGTLILVCSECIHLYNIYI